MRNPFENYEAPPPSEMLSALGIEELLEEKRDRIQSEVHGDLLGPDGSLDRVLEGTVEYFYDFDCSAFRLISYFECLEDEQEFLINAVCNAVKFASVKKVSDAKKRGNGGSVRRLQVPIEPEIDYFDDTLEQTRITLKMQSPDNSE